MLMLDLKATATEISMASRRDVEELCIAPQERVREEEGKGRAEYERGHEDGFEEGQQSNDCEDCDNKYRRIRILEQSQKGTVQLKMRMLGTTNMQTYTLLKEHLVQQGCTPLEIEQFFANLHG